MAIAIEGTPVVDGYQAANTSFTVTLPSNIQAGELLVIDAICGDRTKWFEATGWTTLQMDHTESFDRDILWKLAVGDEGVSVTVDVKSSGSCDAHFSSFRMSGVDTTDPFNSDNFYTETVVSTNSPTFSASSLTIAASNGILTGIACEATRSVSSYDSDLDEEVVMSAGSISSHIHLDYAEASTGNPEYVFSMSDSRDYKIDLLELKAVGGAPSGGFSVINNIYRTIIGG